MSVGPPRPWTIGPCHGLDVVREGVELLELRIEAGDGLSPKALKRLDKAVTVMKIGIKVAKKALREKAAGRRPAPVLVRKQS